MVGCMYELIKSNQIKSTAETAALKATVDTLTKQLDKHIIFPALPLLDLATPPSAMEEITMQLSHVQHDIQDILAAIHNPPSLID
jgi:hypothetical protein